MRSDNSFNRHYFSGKPGRSAPVITAKENPKRSPKIPEKLHITSSFKKKLEHFPESNQENEKDEQMEIKNHIIIPGARYLHSDNSDIFTKAKIHKKSSVLESIGLFVKDSTIKFSEACLIMIITRRFDLLFTLVYILLIAYYIINMLLY